MPSRCISRHIKGPMALAHNGSLVNARQLREELELEGAIFHSTNDEGYRLYDYKRAAQLRIHRRGRGAGR